MKKMIVIVLLFISLSGNAVDEAFFKQVLVANTSESIKSADKLLDAIKKNQAVKPVFLQLIKSWKKVEATYVLGDLNEDYLDTPRYIDIFHGNNENIKIQLDLIIDNNDDLINVLYKHSHKSINALEYILFAKDIGLPRIKKMALMMTTSIKKYLQEILDGYQANQKKFLVNEKYASAILLNTLIDNTYKLKEWRIGDVVGSSKKYKNKADNRRAEYALSGNSIHAIVAILQAQKQVLDSKQYKNFGDVAREFNAKIEIKQAIVHLNTSISIAKQMDKNVFSGEQGKMLYINVSKLMKSYYITLMNKLGFVSKVLDADGD